MVHRPKYCAIQQRPTSLPLQVPAFFISCAPPTVCGQAVQRVETVSHVAVLPVVAWRVGVVTCAPGVDAVPGGWLPAAHGAAGAV